MKLLPLILRPVFVNIPPGTLVKSAYRKTNHGISQPKHVVGTQKNRLNETVLLSTQLMLKLMGKKIFTILRSKI